MAQFDKKRPYDKKRKDGTLPEAQAELQVLSVGLQRALGDLMERVTATQAEGKILRHEAFIGSDRVFTLETFFEKSGKLGETRELCITLMRYQPQAPSQYRIHAEHKGGSPASWEAVRVEVLLPGPRREQPPTEVCLLSTSGSGGKVHQDYVGAHKFPLKHALSEVTLFCPVMEGKRIPNLTLRESVEER